MNENEKSHEESTAADKTSIGFDFQYYYFLLMLLDLQHGETLGYEVKDDIHLEKSNQTNVLIQLKHTIQTNAAGNPINLTERDLDLWKTIYNWIKVINDKLQGRDVIHNQLAFMKNTYFVLASNKVDNQKNNFLVKIKALKRKEISIIEFREYLIELEKTTNDETIKSYITLLIAQSNDWIETFLEKLTFNLSEDDLLERIRIKIIEKIYTNEEHKVNQVLYCIDSNIHMWKFETVKNRGKLLISFDEVRTKFQKCFINFMSNKLPYREYEVDLPKDLKEQTFIKQLLDIEDFPEDDIETMAEFTTLKMQLNKWLEELHQNGDITGDEKERFRKVSVTQWQNAFRAAHRQKINPTLSVEEQEQLMKQNALKCLDEIRKISLKLDNTEIDIDLCNGHFYSLSDKPEIGWHPKWKEKYS
ncbi:ABC-three component system protein [Brevibacillus borstelensis]|uniref:ABC-three component system protein n=1 Tax=Brevibacillus borstelensis TaxID=45462 RepID=UPI002E22B67E|nr:hypothetical protein [Brevibacillus borstelensis]